MQLEFKRKGFDWFGKSMIAIYAYLFLLFAIYYEIIKKLVMVDWMKDDYSHSILIPFIVIYLLWEKRVPFIETKSKPSLIGFYVFGLGVLLYWLGELGGEWFTLYLSFWMIITGLCLLGMGWAKLKVIAFPLCFALTMFPFPAFINNKITLELKLISSKLGVTIMQLYGLTAFRDGNMIDLGFTQLQVVDACSGLRYLYPMIVLSILIAYYYKASIWKRVLLVFSSVPLTILSNSIRIALTGILSEKFGSKAVEGFFHDFEGVLIFMLTLAVLLLEIWILKKIFPKLDNTTENLDNVSKRIEQKASDRPFLMKPHFVLSALLLFATAGFSYGFDFRDAIPLNQSFDHFPMQIEKWKGSRVTMEQEFIDELDLTDYVMAEYKNASDKVKSINFYVAYYENQRKSESIHSPASCLKGGGWQFQEAGSSSMLLHDQTKMPFNRAIIEKEPVKQISYYWFPFRDRILTNAFQMKWFNFWDALTRQRTDGALVRVITVVYPDEDTTAAELRIQNFIRDVVPILKEFLPQ